MAKTRRSDERIVELDLDVARAACVCGLGDGDRELAVRRLRADDEEVAAAHSAAGSDDRVRITRTGLRLEKLGVLGQRPGRYWLSLRAAA